MALHGVKGELVQRSELVFVLAITINNSIVEIPRSACRPLWNFELSRAIIILSCKLLISMVLEFAHVRDMRARCVQGSAHPAGVVNHAQVAAAR